MSLSNVWFTSDLHLGHNGAINFRGFSSVEEHNEVIIENINKLVNKRDKLFILGDVAWKEESLEQLRRLHGVKELIIGNHDTMQTSTYLKYFHKVHGFRKYKEFWLSHCPVHPQELYRVKGNIHGHIHNGAATKPLDLPYVNVNVDFNEYKPVNMEDILARFE